MIRYAFLDKREKERWLPILFDLLYENMHEIAPSGISYTAERETWLVEVSSALERTPREIILALAGGRPVGYLQYYTRGDLLMIEELQLHAAFHRTLLFGDICKYLWRQLPDNITRVEACADKRNLHSLALMKKLGMERIEEDAFVHLSGDLATLRKRLIRK